MAKLPLLSIGMIVKDEIRSIEKCLRTLQPIRNAIPCELVIADTGSTDGTRELVMQYADVFFDFEWINDFSAARNAVMDRCSGKWYFTVDADEYLDPNISEFLKLLTRESDPSVDAYAVAHRSYTDIHDFSCYNEFYAVRLVRMASGARYQNPIHEMLSIGDKFLTIDILDHVIIWHDGYLEHGGQKIIAKQKRNMALLEEQLRETPDNLQLVLQAADSAYTSEQERGYARRLVELVESGKYTEAFKIAPAWQRVLQIAHKQKMWEFSKWYAQAKQMTPKSLLFRVDGNYSAAAVAWNRKDYPAVLEYGTGYLEGVQTLKNAAPEQKAELLYATVWSENEKYRCSTELTMACAYAELRQWDECREILNRYPSKDLKGSDLSMWLHATGTCAVGQKDAGLLKKFSDRVKTIEEWNSIPSITAKLVLENNLPLPNRFFAQSTDRLLALAAELGDQFKEKFPRVLMERTAQDGNDDDPKVVIWNHALLFSALTKADWTSDDAETLQWLVETYAMLSSVLLNFYYNPNILCAEMVELLPDMHHFGWCFLQGCTAKEDGNILEYVRWLRKALKAVPKLKEMIEYLVDGVNDELERAKETQKNTEASPELIQIASQIRTILAQYAPDDPTVLALKQTPAYQMVAHLIADDM